MPGELILAAAAAWVALRGKKSGPPPAAIPGGSSNVQLSSTTKRSTLAWRDVVSREAEGNPNITTALVLAIIARESGGNADAIGADGERGLMQITREAWQDYQAARNDPEAAVFPDDVQRPTINVRVGAWYLSRRILGMGNTYDGLRAFNCGETGARRNKACGAGYAEWVIACEPQFR